MKMIEQFCLDNLENSVTDPVLRERLRPDYRAACKRLVVSTDFYEAIQKPNAVLVTDAITGVEPGRGPHRRRSAPWPGRPRPRHRLPGERLRPAHDRRRSPRSRSGPGLGRATGGLSVHLGPRLPQFLHAQRAQRSGGQFLPGRSGRAPARLHPPTGGAAPVGRGYGRSAPPADALPELEAARVKAAKDTIWSTGCHSWYLDDRGIPAVWPWPFSHFRTEMAVPKWEAFDLRV